jgi:hypothetical protein
MSGRCVRNLPISLAGTLQPRTVAVSGDTATGITVHLAGPYPSWVRTRTPVP